MGLSSLQPTPSAAHCVQSVLRRLTCFPLSDNARNFYSVVFIKTLFHQEMAVNIKQRHTERTYNSTKIVWAYYQNYSCFSCFQSPSAIAYTSAAHGWRKIIWNWNSVYRRILNDLNDPSFSIVMRPVDFTQSLPWHPIQSTPQSPQQLTTNLFIIVWQAGAHSGAYQCCRNARPHSSSSSSSSPQWPLWCCSSDVLVSSFLSAATESVRPHHLHRHFLDSPWSTS